MAKEGQLGSPDFSAYMHSPLKKYDSETQMYMEDLKEPTLERLGFIRWLVEHDRLEHVAAGASGGEYAPIKQLVGGAARFRISPQSPLKSGSAH